MIIDIQKLSYSFGQGKLERKVLSEIDLKIRPGEVAIIKGPSGSGKTTLLTLIGALRSFREGSLKVLGDELRGSSYSERVRIRRQIGYIFQSHNLLSFLTARQNVWMSLQLHHGLSKHEVLTRTNTILKNVGLNDRLDDYPDSLSVGQKQRVAIARALVSHPKLVLADEPTASLDSRSGRDVVELMQHLAREFGSAILIVTHDDRIIDIADRVLSLEDGRLTRDEKNGKDREFPSI
ncbi:MAG: ATP-binding cassette domain-containing protein [Cyanobacteria bacterium SID2]|nr:ATP-binding cassette domain-containing protein [Cyanobacteria bacterium SID2]MBP0004978.1 ATP-binding cassette domain-containing protein [Cyanobacteria bacterium SBC]